MKAARPSIDVVSAALFAVAAGLAFQQIDTESLWWDLARGRSVAAGNFLPSATLLAGDEQAEADWLGGFPWFLIHATLGPHGLMVGRCCSVFGLLLFLRRLVPERPASLTKTAILASWLLAVSPALDPTGSWWDVVLGTLLLSISCPWKKASLAFFHLGNSPKHRGLWGLPIAASRGGRLFPQSAGTPPPAATERSAPGSWWERNSTLVIRCGLTVLWVNLGPRSLLAVAGCHSVAGLLATLACLCLSPRGVFGLTDSLQVLVPPLAIMVGEGESASWLNGYPIAADRPAVIQFVGWGILSYLAASRLGQDDGPRRRGRRVFGWFIPQLLILANPASLPAVTPYLGFLAITSSTGIRLQPSVGSIRLSESTCRGLAAGLLAGLALLLVSGPWMISSGRLGWGFSPRLEVRQLATVLGTRPQAGTVFAFDTRAAGMAAWVLDSPAAQRPREKPGRLQPWLTPQRALLTGRFAAEARLAADLRSGWDMQHADSTGSSGGWWQPLLSRHTQLVFVPAEDAKTLRHLEPTLYKPILIDAPVFPYALSGNPQLSPAIVRTLADRELVEWGRWTLDGLRPSHTDQAIDLWGILSGRPDPRPLIRQARVFLALNLPRAALKILRPLAQARLTRSPAELSGATLLIAEFERLKLGQPTSFRAAVLARLDGQPAVGSRLAESLAALPPAALQAWAAIAEAYLEAGPVAAIGLLPSQEREAAWTGAMLWIEAGQPDRARAALNAILEQPDTRLENQTRMILERLPEPRSPR